ncbi:hypothetical protein LCGC14_1156930 [marine sediment metagenome]|uniref:Uncharacterized protein n=1 Tax=marine sediment metagenome TaxID=412755 RepID=A0A0F9MGW0_9ZZZZ
MPIKKERAKLIRYLFLATIIGLMVGYYLNLGAGESKSPDTENKEQEIITFSVDGPTLYMPTRNGHNTQQMEKLYFTCTSGHETLMEIKCAECGESFKNYRSRIWQ